MDSIYAGMTDIEKHVAKYLRAINLWWVYEFPVFVYDEKKRPRVWTPDFYIPKLGMHIEVCGSEDFNYKYRDKIYKKWVSCNLSPSLQSEAEMEELSHQKNNGN